MFIRMTGPGEEDDGDRPLLPTEVEIYINPDGSVTFADLEASLVEVARKLDPGSLEMGDRNGGRDHGSD